MLSPYSNQSVANLASGRGSTMPNEKNNSDAASSAIGRGSTSQEQRGRILSYLGNISTQNADGYFQNSQNSQGVDTDDYPSEIDTSNDDEIEIISAKEFSGQNTQAHSGSQHVDDDEDDLMQNTLYSQPPEPSQPFSPMVQVEQLKAKGRNEEGNRREQGKETRARRLNTYVELHREERELSRMSGTTEGNNDIYQASQLLYPTLNLQNNTDYVYVIPKPQESDQGIPDHFYVYDEFDEQLHNMTIQELIDFFEHP